MSGVKIYTIKEAK
jgi:hypothetical protein